MIPGTNARIFLKETSFIDHVITHELPMEDINEGFRLMSESKAVKVVLDF